MSESALPPDHPTNQPSHSTVDKRTQQTVEDPLKPETFPVPHPESEGARLVIEFCDRCRWLHRATWAQTELFLTFPHTPDQTGLSSITLMPRNAPETAGRWRVWMWIQGDPDCQGKLLWDRKTEETGFGEMKALKQRVRDVLLPDKSLGHSDGHKKQ